MIDSWRIGVIVISSIILGLEIGIIKVGWAMSLGKFNSWIFNSWLVGVVIISTIIVTLEVGIIIVVIIISWLFLIFLGNASSAWNGSRFSWWLWIMVLGSSCGVVIVLSFELMFEFSIIKSASMVWNLIVLLFFLGNASSSWNSDWFSWWLWIMVLGSSSSIVIVSGFELMLVFGIIEGTSIS